MLRRTVLPAVVALVAAAMGATSVGAASVGHAAVGATTAGAATKGEPPPGTNAGPPYEFMTELMSYAPDLGIKDKMILSRTKLGYRLWSGQQSSHLVVTLVNDGRGLRVVDAGTESFKKLASSCRRLHINPGVGAVCHVPQDITARRPLLVEVWPRLGNDFTDTSALPATFAVTMLGDAGNDVAHFGAGPDFFNGYQGRDRVWGGGGNDWIRAGVGNDSVEGGAGNDDVVAVEGDDTIHGGDGHDRLWSGDGSDTLWGGAGDDYVLCGNGQDLANVDAGDRVFHDCESINQG